MRKVGLTGGYATGKSFVAEALAEWGCHVISADRLGHEVLERGQEAYAAVVETFGREMLDGEEAIDRKRLGAMVFGSEELLGKLTAIVHPAVFRLEEKTIAEWERRDPGSIVVVEAAILIETGRYRAYDVIVLTTCSEELQIRRGMRRDDLTREQVKERLARQMPFEEKKRVADYVIDTSGTKEATLEEVRRIYEELRGAQRAGA